MIILDTNVLSELIRPISDGNVLTWLDSRDRNALAITAITKAEMLSGAAALEDGARKRHLIELIRVALAPFKDATLPFDGNAAERFADVVTARQRIGRPIGTMDAQIAAIALAKGATVATRDTSGFADLGIDLIDPWTV